MKNIGVIGLWHLGCVLSATWAKLGYKVVGFDYSVKTINDLNENKPPIYEPGLAELIGSAMSADRLAFSSNISDLQNCDYVFVAFDTPVSDNDECDITQLRKAIIDVAGTLKKDALVIVSSQTPVGTCRDFRDILKGQNADLELVCSPENLRLGSAIDCYFRPGRIIIGSETEKAKNMATELFSSIDADIITMNLSSSEMTKHGINSFLANSVVFADQLANLCEVSGANIIDVVKGVKSDERIGQKAYLSPGIGFSGGTLGRDLRVLTKLNRDHYQCSSLYEDILEFNHKRKNFIIQKARKIVGGDLNEKNISVLGVTYKPGTSTLRRSIPLEIVELLSSAGANVKVYDPKANWNELRAGIKMTIEDSIDKALKDADLVVLLTEWSEFKEYDWKKGRSLVREPNLFDAKNFLLNNNLPDSGFIYHGVGISLEV